MKLRIKWIILLAIVTFTRIIITWWLSGDLDADNTSISNSNIVPVSKLSPTYLHHQQQSLPLITLFTTFKPDASLNVIYSNTIDNWVQLCNAVSDTGRPATAAAAAGVGAAGAAGGTGAAVRLVLFSSSSEEFKKFDSLEERARERGWTVLPVPSVNAFGTPHLLAMVNVTMNMASSQSLVYGYSNGDILFQADSLLQTVHAVLSSLQPPLLIIGRRTNVYVNASLTSEVLRNITGLASSAGRLYRVDAQDYFLFVQFPWHKMENVVIGRASYDNYIVDRAVRLGVRVVDATDTITAVHQQLLAPDDPARAKEPDYSYNAAVLGRFRRTYKHGLTTSAPYATRFNLDTDPDPVQGRHVEVYRRRKASSF